MQLYYIVEKIDATVKKTDQIKIFMNMLGKENFESI